MGASLTDAAVVRVLTQRKAGIYKKKGKFFLRKVKMGFVAVREEWGLLRCVRSKFEMLREDTHHGRGFDGRRRRGACPHAPQGGKLHAPQGGKTSRNERPVF